MRACVCEGEIYDIYFSGAAGPRERMNAICREHSQALLAIGARERSVTFTNQEIGSRREKQRQDFGMIVV